MSEMNFDTGEREEMLKITAPFEPEQVAILNEYQALGVFHPFTCGNEVMHRDPAKMEEWQDALLVATPEGWVCPDEGCGYTQDWAWAFMADSKAIAEIARNNLKI